MQWREGAEGGAAVRGPETVQLDTAMSEPSGKAENKLRSILWGKEREYKV